MQTVKIDEFQSQQRRKTHGSQVPLILAVGWCFGEKRIHKTQNACAPQDHNVVTAICPASSRRRRMRTRTRRMAADKHDGASSPLELPSAEWRCTECNKQKPGLLQDSDALYPHSCELIEHHSKHLACTSRN